MKNRYLTALVLLLGIGCLVMIGLALLPPRHGVTAANLDRIEIGMTLKEVDETFGQECAFAKLSGGAGIYFSSSIVGREDTLTQGGFAWSDWTCHWSGEDGQALITFDDDGHAASKSWSDSSRPLLRKLWQWLRLPGK